MQTKIRHHIRRLSVKCAFFGASAVFSAAVCAQNAIENVSSFIQGGSEIVRIDLSAPLSALPAGFVVQSPPRIALDFPGVASKLPRNAIDFNRGNLRSAQVVQGGERSRVVFSLNHATTSRISIV